MAWRSVLGSGACLLALVGLPACKPASDEEVPGESTLALEACTQWDRGLFWCAATLADGSGKVVGGKTLADFTLTEAAVSPDGDVLERRAITFEKPDYQFHGPGFWAREVTPQKLDLLFILDGTGSMEPFRSGIRSELHRLVTRLSSDRVDYRIALMELEDYGIDRPTFSDDRPVFLGPMMQAELDAEIDAYDTGGESWRPTPIYEALLLVHEDQADWLGWRSDAKKKIVVVTDSIAQTPYGSDWYFNRSSTATKGSVELLYGTGVGRPIDILYAQAPDAGDPDKDVSVADHCARNDDGESYTPRSCGSEAGFASFGERLAWPLSGDDVYDHLGVTPEPISDARYYFAWKSELAQGGADDSVRIALDVADPADAGKRLHVGTDVPLVLPHSRWSVVATDEVGASIPEARFDLFRVMGDRVENVTWQQTIADGSATLDQLDCGDYLLYPYTRGDKRFAWERLRYEGFADVPVCGDAPGQATLTLFTGDKTFHVATARGLLNELSHWAVHRPFAGFADQGNAWVSQLEQGGVSWQETEQLKRFSVGLSGYVNASGYAEIEVLRAVQDFVDASKQIRKFAQDVQHTGDGLAAGLIDPDTLALLAKYTSELNTGAVDAHVTEDALTQALLNWAKKDLVPEALKQMAKLLDSKLENKQLASTLMLLATQIAFGGWDDLPAVLERLGPTLVEEALQEVSLQLTDQLAQELGGKIADALDARVDLPDEAKALTRVAAEAFLKQGISGFQGNFEGDLGSAIDAAISKLGDEAKVRAAVQTGFDAIHDALDAGPLRDFALPMAQLFLNVAIEHHATGKVSEDAVIEVVSTMFCNFVILPRFYEDRVGADLGDLLARAKSFSATGSVDDRAKAMDKAFVSFRRDIMRPLNADAWAALALQDSVDDWESWISTAQVVFGALVPATAAGCTYYPEVCKYVDDVAAVMAALDALRVMTNILEFGMKLDAMDHFASSVGAANETLFPKLP